MATKEKAFELDTAAAGYSGGEAVHFGDFPGTWAPGVPIALTELGFDTAADAREAVKTRGLPLKEVTVDAGSAPMPERPNHAPADDIEKTGTEVPLGETATLTGDDSGEALPPVKGDA